MRRAHALPARRRVTLSMSSAGEATMAPSTAGLRVTAVKNVTVVKGKPHCVECGDPLPSYCSRPGQCTCGRCYWFVADWGQEGGFRPNKADRRPDHAALLQVLNFGGTDPDANEALRAARRGQK
jgi:hypothetical protein